jgi:hypothetical protein
MARYSLISIDGIYLTRDGLDSGVRCKVDVEGLLALRLTNGRVIRNAITGTPRMQRRSVLGKPIAMVIASKSKSTMDDLIDAINTAETSGQVHAVTIEGDSGDFDLDLVLESLEGPDSFRNGILNRISLAFRVHTVNSIAAGS